MDKHIWTDHSRPKAGGEKRKTHRTDLCIPARMTWKDHLGATRFASVITRNVSISSLGLSSTSSTDLARIRKTSTATATAGFRILVVG